MIGHVLSAIAYLNWERNLAATMGMTHGMMKDLVIKKVITPWSTIEEARKSLASHQTTERR